MIVVSDGTAFRVQPVQTEEGSDPQLARGIPEKRPDMSVVQAAGAFFFVSEASETAASFVEQVEAPEISACP